MVFISKKRFEAEVRSRIEELMVKEEERRWRADEIREVHQRIGRLERLVYEIADKCEIPTNKTAINW